MDDTEQPQQQPDLSILAKKWLARFEQCVRKRLYEQAKMMCHGRVVWCGLESNVALGWQDVENQEWSQCWPGQLVFTMDLALAKIISTGPMVMVIVPWSSKGLIHGSAPKNGRATFLLGVFDEDHKVLCVHAHFSLNPKSVLVKA